MPDHNMPSEPDRPERRTTKKQRKAFRAKVLKIASRRLDKIAADCKREPALMLPVLAQMMHMTLDGVTCPHCQTELARVLMDMMVEAVNEAAAARARRG